MAIRNKCRIFRPASGAFLLALCLLISGCHPDARYKIMSRLFDGVPENKPVAGARADSLSEDLPPSATGDREAAREKSPHILHAPYGEGMCENCHDADQGYALLADTPELCANCHTDFSEEYAVLHGPAAAGLCGECHQAHSSVHPRLLRWGENGFCLNCHDPEDVFDNDAHEDVGENDCQNCHNPHGGEDESLLN